MSDEKEEYVSDGDDNSVDVPDVEDLDDDQADAIDDIDDIDDMDDEESVDNDLENKEDKPSNSSINVIDDVDGDDEDDGDDGDDSYYDYDETENFMKFDDELKNNYIENYHPEEVSINYDEVKALCSITRDRDGIIVDELHKSLPILTKYEYTNILGLRAKQINQGCKPFISVNKEILDGYLIAQIELKQKALPFIVKRPIPNGGIEYWRLSDLEILI
mgnify:FL=1|tara:strand:+ start:40 stop:693 length:654 start_codon:yes stop_codon:yes gene_type:complete